MFRFPIRVTLCCAFWLGISAGGNADEAKPLDPSQPYQARRVNPVQYDVDFAVVVTAPSNTKRLCVWLPLPQSDAGQEVEPGELTTFPLQVKPRLGQEPVFGNRFAYFEFVQPQGAQLIRHRFKIRVWELHWDLDPNRVQKVNVWPPAFAPYLKGDQTAAVDDPLSIAARNIVKQPRGPAYDLNALMDWIQGNLTYDYARASYTANATRAFTVRAGHCSDYHGLCAAFGRALGVPTRVTYGINPFPKNSPSHCKLEAFLPPYGWVNFDVSETQKLIRSIRSDASLDATAQQQLAQAAEERLRRGFRDNTWFLQTKGTDYDLAPPASRKVRLVRTIYAEADGVPLPDPEPADPARKEFAWMTLHQYKADKDVTYPYRDYRSLRE